MKCNRYDMNGYTLYTMLTDRFKTIGIRINVRTKNIKEDEKYMPMIRRMLINTSSNYNSIREINEACANLYDPNYSINYIDSGSQSILSLSASLTNEKYTEKGMNEKTIKFLLDHIFKPKVRNDCFDEEIFEIQKNKLIEQYLSIKDHPRDYANGRLEEQMDVKEFKTSSLNEIIDDTKKITSKDTYEYYKKILKEGRLDIFVCGSFDKKEMKHIFDRNLHFKGKNDERNHIIVQKKYNKTPKIIIEKSKNVQSTLLVGCKAIDITDIERKYVFVLYSWILGGGMNSLLNQTIREKNSLCYYIYAERRNLLGIMKICAGINGEDFEKCYKLIKDEMKNMIVGNFSDELLESVKEIYYNSLISIEDYQDDMMGSYISEIFTGSDDIETRKRMISKITKEDIMKFSSKVYIDTVFLLKGDSNE